MAKNLSLRSFESFKLVLDYICGLVGRKDVPRTFVLFTAFKVFRLAEKDILRVAVGLMGCVSTSDAAEV